METLIKKRVIKAINSQVFPACVVGIIKNRKRIVLPFGHFTDKKDSLRVNQDSIFDVASITKVIPTACLALKLLENNQLKLEDKLIKFIPEFTGQFRERILIRHLLTQTLEFGFRFSSWKNYPPKELIKKMLSANLISLPGTRLSPSNITSNLLGLTVERIHNLSLDKAAYNIFFKPLKMTRTTFHPEIFPKREVVPTEIDPWRKKLIWAEPHDESTYALRPKIVGAAGLFSTAPDLLNFLEMLLNEGRWNGQNFFRPETIKKMSLNQIREAGESYGLGWELNRPRYMGTKTSGQCFGKTGFTGCLIICDISKNTGLIILANSIYPVRKSDTFSIDSFRRDIADIVFENS